MNNLRLLYLTFGIISYCYPALTMAQSDLLHELKYAARNREPNAIVALVDYYIASGSKEERQYFVDYGIRALRARAALGDREAVKYLINIYTAGKWLEADNERAEFWKKHAANLGDYRSFLLLYNDQNRIENIAKKLENFAQSGNASAWYELGNYHSGIYKRKSSPAKAIKAYEQGAQAGNSNAMVLYAHWLLLNNTIDDTENAIGWLEKAADKGEAQAHYTLALMCRQWKHFITSPGPVCYSYHMRIAAEGGIADAQFRMANILLSNNKPRAVEYAKSAANQQHSGAKLWLIRHK